MGVTGPGGETLRPDCSDFIGVSYANRDIGTQGDRDRNVILTLPEKGKNPDAK